MGNSNSSSHRPLSPDAGGSDSDDSDISLGGTSPTSPSSSPQPASHPHHQSSPSHSTMASIGPVRTQSLNFRFDPIAPSSFRFGPTTSYKFPAASFRFEPHSPQHNHPNIAAGGIFRLAETSPFQAVGPRGDLGSRLPDPLCLQAAAAARLYPPDTLIHPAAHQLSESISGLSSPTTVDLASAAPTAMSHGTHSPPLVATNLSVTGPLRVAAPSPHTPSSRGSPPHSGLIKMPSPRSPPPQATPIATKPPHIHRPFSPA